MITKDFETSENNETLSSLTPLEEKIIRTCLSAVITGESSVLEAAVLTQEYFDNPKPQGLQHEALSAHLLLSTYKRILPETMRTRLQEVVSEAKKDHSGILIYTQVGINVLKGEVESYFRGKRSRPYEYFIGTPLDDVLAHEVIRVEAFKIAQSKKHELEAIGKKDCVLTPFIDQKTGSPGIWMSSKGIKFDKSKLR